jgi:cystathionine beta-lyase
MKYDFDKLTQRRGTGCFKHDGLKLIYGREDLTPLWVADMEFEVAPAIRAALQSRLDHGIFGYNFRLPVFYEVAANWIAREYGFKIGEEWILTSPGIVPGINLAVLQFTEPHDPILIQTPVYGPFFDAVRLNGRKLLTNPLVFQENHWQIDWEDFEGKLSKARMFILCNPHNPVGRLWSEQELKRMGRLCVKYGVKVVSDEIHADIVYDGQTFLSYGAVEDFADHSVCCFSPAKSFNVAGLSSAVLVVKDPVMRKELDSLIMKLHLHVGNSFGIEALIAAWRDSREWLRQMVGYLQGNRDLLIEVLAKDFPGLRMARPQCTYLGWMDYSGLGLDEEQLMRLLVNKAHLGLDPGSKFGDSSFIRINFACQRSILGQALSRMKAAIYEA